MYIFMKKQVLQAFQMPSDLDLSLLVNERLEIGCMLRITTETKRGRTVLSVEGRIAGSSVSILEQCWRDTYVASPRQKFSVNLCGVSFIDSAGKVLLKEMHRHGAALLAEGCLNQAIVEEIVESERNAPRSSKSGKGAPIIFYVALLSFVFSPAFGRAQGNPALPGPAPTETLKLSLARAGAPP